MIPISSNIPTRLLSPLQVKLEGDYRFPVHLSVSQFVRSVSIYSVFQTFLCCPLRYWLKSMWIHLEVIQIKLDFGWYFFLPKLWLIPLRFSLIGVRHVLLQQWYSQNASLNKLFIIYTNLSDSNRNIWLKSKSS